MSHKIEPPDKIDSMLAEQGDTSREHWQDLITASLPPPPRPRAFVKAPFRMSHELSKYASICAAAEGVSREEWIRLLMAHRIQEMMGIPPEELLIYRRAVYQQHTKERLRDVGQA